MNWFYVAIVLGIILWLAIVFQALEGMRVIQFHGARHATVHRWVGFALVFLSLFHGVLAIGTLLFGWF